VKKVVVAGFVSAAVLTALLALLSPSAPADERSELYPLRPGASWTYEAPGGGRVVIRALRTERVGERDAVVLVTEMAGQEISTWVAWTDRGLVMLRRAQGGQTVTFPQPVLVLKHPAKAGDAWSTTVDGTKIEYRVEGTETKDVLGRRVEAVRVTERAATPYGPVETTTWYGAGIGVLAMVMRQGGQSAELRLAEHRAGVDAPTPDPVPEPRRDVPAPAPTPTPTPEGWRAYDNALLGVSMKLPADWTVDVSEQGLLVASPGVGDPRRPRAFVTHAVLAQRAAPSALARILSQSMSLTLADYREVDVRDVGDAMARLRFRTAFGGRPARGVLFVAVAGPHVELSGFLSPEEAFEESAATLTQIVSSASFRSPGVRLTSYTEPNETAFTVQVPEGWQVRGLVDRRWGDANLAIFLADPSGRIRVSRQQLEAPYTNPMPFFQEGSRYNAGGGTADIEVRTMVGAVDFLRAEREGRLLWVRPRADLLDAYATSPFATHLGYRYDAADAMFRLPDGRTRYRQVLLQYTPGGGWYVTSQGYEAPEADLATAQGVLALVLATNVPNHDWAMAEARGAAQRLAIIQSTNTEIVRILQETTVNRARASSKAAEAWSQYIRHGGYTPVRNAVTGETKSVTPSRFGDMQRADPNWKTNW
jgi:hypothetical protein